MPRASSAAPTSTIWPAPGNLHDCGRMTALRFPRAVLFDLDGTLLDSAPDMLETVNLLRDAEGLAPMTLAQIRPHVSKGSRAMLAAAFPHQDTAEREARVPRFLEI